MFTANVSMMMGKMRMMNMCMMMHAQNARLL